MKEVELEIRPTIAMVDEPAVPCTGSATPIFFSSTNFNLSQLSPFCQTHCFFHSFLILGSRVQSHESRV